MIIKFKCNDRWDTITVEFNLAFVIIIITPLQSIVTRVHFQGKDFCVWQFYEFGNRHLIGSWISFCYIAFTLHKTQRCAYIFIKSCNVSRLFKQKHNTICLCYIDPKLQTRSIKQWFFSLTNSHLLLTNEDFFKSMKDWWNLIATLLLKFFSND